MDTVVQRGASAQDGFLNKVYLNLFGSVVALILVEYALFASGVVLPVAAILTKSWLLTLGAFMIIGTLASQMAYRIESVAGQYAALGLYIIANALILSPLLITVAFRDPSVMVTAAVYTLLAFGALTAVVFVSKKDFSFLRMITTFGFILAMILIAVSLIFGLNLGVWFSFAMVGLTGASILHETSNLVKRGDYNRPVAATLSLFASLTTMFWYVLQIFGGRD